MNTDERTRYLAAIRYIRAMDQYRELERVGLVNEEVIRYVKLARYEYDRGGNIWHRA